MSELSKNSWVQTYTGKKFFPLKPDENSICIEDIAHSLSMQCRYVGHTRKFYSVAEHSVLLVKLYFPNDVRLARYALLHDASEAYLTDLPGPLKPLPQFNFYRQAERRLQAMIYLRFGLDPCEPDEIKRADKAIVGEEAEVLMAPLHKDWTSGHGTGRLTTRGFASYRPLQPSCAEHEFLQAFDLLFKGKISL